MLVGFALFLFCHLDSLPAIWIPSLKQKARLRSKHFVQKFTENVNLDTVVRIRIRDGIRCFFDPGSCFFSDSGSQTYIFDSLMTNFCVEVL
jgi:hypothetical protein